MVTRPTILVRILGFVGVGVVALTLLALSFLYLFLEFLELRRKLHEGVRIGSGSHVGIPIAGLGGGWLAFPPGN